MSATVSVVLAERPEDVRYLARHRVSHLNREDGRHWKRLSREAEQRLAEQGYDGNVRELFNVVDRAWHDAVQQIGPEHVDRARQQEAEEARREHAARDGERTPDGLRRVDVRFGDDGGFEIDFGAPGMPLKQLQERAACQMVRQALEHFEGDAERVARFLDISRRSVYRYMQRDRHSRGGGEEIQA